MSWRSEGRRTPLLAPSSQPHGYGGGEEKIIRKVAACMTDTKTNDFSYEQRIISVDASFIDGFDVDDDEERWTGKPTSTAPPRNKRMIGGQPRRR